MQILTQPRSKNNKYKNTPPLVGGQLSLLSPSSPQAARVSLQIEPVPARLALGPDRFFLVAVQGDRRWFYPIQFTRLEALSFLRELQGLDWRLGENGVPLHAETIHEAAERLIDGGGV